MRPKYRVMSRVRIIALVALAAVVLAVNADAFGVVTEPLPVGATGQPYGYQFKVHGGNPPYTYSVSAGVLPPGLWLSSSGRLIGAPQVPGSWTFYVEASYRYDSNPPLYSQRKFTLDVVVGLSIRNRSLPVATAGVPYKATLAAAGGGTQAWSVNAGALPPGLALARDGLITGSPRKAGAFTFTAEVMDDFRLAEKKLSLKVVKAPTVAAPSLPAAVVGSPFSATVRVVGGLAPYTWAMRNGARPPGVTISRGSLTGTPLVAGRYSFEVIARDAVGNTAALRLALGVLPRVKILVQALEPGVAGRPYRGRIRVRGGAAPLTFELADGDLAPGMTLNTNTGALAGNPSSEGRYAFAIAVADRTGSTHRRTFVLRVR